MKLGSFMGKSLSADLADRRLSRPEKVPDDARSHMGGARTDHVASGVFHPDLSPVSGPGAGGHVDHGATDRHQPAAHRAVSGTGACIFLSSGVFAAPLVGVGPGSRLDHIPAGPWGPAGAGAPGGRRYGH